MTSGAPLHLVGMYGLGDNIYQRPLVRALAARHPLWLTTPWPDIYADLDVKFVNRPTRLRTQAKNMARQPAMIWSRPPTGCASLRMCYGPRQLATMGIAAALETCVPPDARGISPFDLPDMGPCPDEMLAAAAGRPIALVRPVTRRAEWESASRGPDPRYIQEAIDLLRSRGYFIVSVADVEEGAEWFDGTPPERVDMPLHRGELTVRPLLALLRVAAVAVGGVGWIAPAAVAVRAPLYLIFGGRGAHNAPSVIFDQRLDLARVRWALPDRFCRCDRPDHACDKSITGFAARFAAWLDGLPARGFVQAAT